MPRRSTLNPTSTCVSINPANLESFDEIVRAYIQVNRPEDKLDVKDWTDHGCLSAAVRAAAFSTRRDGKRHPHQYRIPAAALKRAADVLDSLDFSNVNSFDELHQIVEHSIKSPKIMRIGELTVYDIAHRIGINLNLSPKLIYLHCGARDGARALGFDGKTLHKNQLPTEFAALTPAEIENCLCIYKEQIRTIAIRPKA